jgi:hypothetical protein
LRISKKHKQKNSATSLVKFGKMNFKDELLTIYETLFFGRFCGALLLFVSVASFLCTAKINLSRRKIKIAARAVGAAKSWRILIINFHYFTFKINLTFI